MTFSKEDARTLAGIERALARDDPEFAERVGLLGTGRHRLAATVAACLSAVILLLTGGILVPAVPGVGLVVAFYGVLTLVVVVVVFVRDSRTVT